ncbi:efflux RND transporter periplasmic adaptor subunit [Planctomycetota bacterium]
MRSIWSRLWSRAWRLLPILGGIVLLVGAIAWMSGTFHSKVPPGTIEHERSTAEGRTVVPVETLPMTETVDAVGTVQPRHKTEVAGQILATVRDVAVSPGDRVEMGQLLVVLDDREIQTQLREAEAAATGARVDLDVREGDFKRYQQMFRENAVTKEDFDRIEGAYKGAQAQVERVAEQVARMRVMLTYTEVKAQAAGIVADRYVDPGDLAVPGKPLLTLHDPKERELHASVPESLTSAIKLNMELPVRIDAVGRECHGVVREIVPQAQQMSRSVLVKVTLPAEAVNHVYIGMFGRLSIPTAQTNWIVVPAEAVRQVGQEDLVEVVGEGGTLERRFVRTGRGHGEKVEILSGLNVGEKVVLPES